MMAQELTKRPGIALVTGATAGIGAEFARQLADRHYDLVLVARDQPRLESNAATLIASYGVAVEILQADLLTVAGRTAVEERVAATTTPIDLLVNNAGFGLRKTFDKNTIDDEQRLLDILVTVPMRLTHAALGQMLPRASGTIVNIASVAGFSPRGSYGAAKAWVISFSRWANIHYRSRGITITGVAPGFVRTEFHERMEVGTDTIPSFMWLNTEQLVRGALRDVDRGKGVSVPTLRYKVIVWLTHWLPARLIAAWTLRGR